MVTIQEVVERRQALEQAKQGMRRERVQQVKQQAQRLVKNIRQSNYKQTFTTPKSKGQIPTKKVQSAFLKMFGQGQAVKSQKGQKNVGRPRSVYVHRSPLTGKPVPAQVYNKEMRFIRRRQSDIATQRQLQIQQNMARQGITPQQAQQIELQRYLQARQPRQMPTQQVIVQPMPSQAQDMPQAGQVQPPQQPSIWRRQQGQIVTDSGLFGRRLIRTQTPESFWN